MSVVECNIWRKEGNINYQEAEIVSEYHHFLLFFSFKTAYGQFLCINLHASEASFNNHHRFLCFLRNFSDCCFEFVLSFLFPSFPRFLVFREERIILNAVKKVVTRRQEDLVKKEGRGVGVRT